MTFMPWILVIGSILATILASLFLQSWYVALPIAAIFIWSYIVVRTDGKFRSIDGISAIANENRKMVNLNTDFSKIEPHHFFSCQKDKTKFNWFAFELACEIDHAVPYQLKTYLSKKGYTKQTFNKSCIKLAMLLQGVVLKKLKNEIPDMQLNYSDVEKSFPKLNEKTINKLLDCTGNAWGTLLDNCIVCPSACLSNKDDYCPMFDDGEFDDCEIEIMKHEHEIT